MREFELINWIKEVVGNAGLPVGIGDDCAVLPKSEGEQLFASDTILSGTHFTDQSPIDRVGHKAIAICLSDIAAMGGRPTGALINLMLPSSLKEIEIKQLMQGMIDTLKRHSTPLCGGDTTVWDGPLGISISLIGEPIESPILRSGAKIGDSIWISGPLGNSFGSGHHLSFEPRFDLVWKLIAKTKVNSMIDVSDGLAQDLGHILIASQVGALLESDSIPLRSGASIQDALSDGEDFELCFTAPTKFDPSIEGLGCTKIGTIVEERGIQFTKGEDYMLKGFEHITFD
jgi:thiamine-monophosphate kinase